MDTSEMLGLAFTIAIASCLAIAISLLFTSQFRKRRSSNRNNENVKQSCYLHAESKPQSNFKRVLADNSFSQFKHLMLNSPDSISNESCTNLHTYKVEISALLKNPKLEILEFLDGNGEEFGRGDGFVWVDTEAKLVELAEVLGKGRVFGVDTEQHSLRSFLGFTCLVQISTKTMDYLVDTIALHDVMGILRPVFCNPGICKVFHGADNDILWLQRDFHIYVVNLFDTAKACDVLAKPQRSLAYLLEAYCGVTTNKLLQREDWRRRPLPEEMIQYARTDAHYLLYIANCLALELQQQNQENPSGADDKFHFILEALRRSNASCLQLFSKDVEVYPGESAASSIVSRCLSDQGNVPSRSCDSKFQERVRQLCAWREIMARIHDESLRYVLSDIAIMMLSAKSTTTDMDICTIISEADSNYDSSNANNWPKSPYPVVCSHLEDFSCLFQDKAELDDSVQLIIRKCLGSNGSCPQSVYNYALLYKTSLKQINKFVSKQNGFKAVKQAARKASRELFVQKFSCKSPVYHNCRIYANDGRLLCYCDRRKLEWYLGRNLAKLVEEDPPAIILLFEPKGRPEDEDNDFYIQSKKNICVGCGEGNHYLRYRIIPSCYRIHFPEHLKSHRSHDIVLLCVDCHEIAHAAAERYKRKIAAEYGIPLFIRRVVDSNLAENTLEPSATIVNFDEKGVSPLQLRTAAMALLRHGSRMPSKRREELTQIVMDYYGGREISEGDLEKALLVGMSPNERRRFEKKRSSASKRPTRAVISDIQENCDSTTNETSKTNGAYCTGSNSEETHIFHGNSDLLTVEEMDVRRPSPSPSFDLIGEVSVDDSTCTNLKENIVSTTEYVTVLDSCESLQNGNPADESTNSVETSYDGNDSSKHDSKVSLLGHGPHGKQVVEYLLKEYGEEGILDFCQRWRQVFVEAVRPSFLPAGWDVKHSGKRDFGEFSVYKPSKKTPDAATTAATAKD